MKNDAEDLDRIVRNAQQLDRIPPRSEQIKRQSALTYEDAEAETAVQGGGWCRDS